MLTCYLKEIFVEISKLLVLQPPQQKIRKKISKKRFIEINLLCIFIK
jgi:hypothetical protein